MLGIFCGGALMGGLAWGNLTPLASASPIEVASFTLDRPYDPATRVLYLSSEVRRNRACEGTITRMIRREPDGAIVWRERVPAAPLPITANFIPRHAGVVIPDLPHGQYDFTFSVHSYCNNRDNYDVLVGPIGFSVG